MHSSNDSAGMPQPINKLKYLSTWTHSVLCVSTKIQHSASHHSLFYRVLASALRG